MLGHECGRCFENGVSYFAAVRFNRVFPKSRHDLNIRDD
jgi:hypothetical protein